MIRKVRIQCAACAGSGGLNVIDPISLRETRQAAGISLREFAKRIKFTAPYISDIENGRRNCTLQIEEAYSQLKPKKGK